MVDKIMRRSENGSATFDLASPPEAFGADAPAAPLMFMLYLALVCAGVAMNCWGKTLLIRFLFAFHLVLVLVVNAKKRDRAVVIVPDIHSAG